MAVYNIVKIGDDVLRENAKEIRAVTQNIKKLLDNMADTMYAADGVGLAAPQIGVSKRVIIVDIGEGLIELINPVLLETSGEDIDLEGCLSIPNVQEEVKRFKEVTVKGLDRDGKEITITAEGLLARALQHEIDHLEGILFVDRVNQK